MDRIPLNSIWADFDAGSRTANAAVITNGSSESWSNLWSSSRDLAKDLRSGSAYLIDPSGGHKAIVSLLAALSVRNVDFVWATPDCVKHGRRHSDAPIYAMERIHKETGDRSYYGTATSGSTGAPKIPLGYADQLRLVGRHYYETIYSTILPSDSSAACIVSSMPVEYAAVFMMAVLPSLAKRCSLWLGKASDWSKFYDSAQQRPMALLTVPGMLPAAMAATAGLRDIRDFRELALITTAGRLSQSRVNAARERLPGVMIMSSYGASETGVMTLDLNPTGAQHVGKPLTCKPIWIRDADANGVGSIATSGPDTRHSYLDGGLIASSDGSVAGFDRGHFDGHGNLCLDGRPDQGQKLHGITVYLQQVESHILLLPGVQDVSARVMSDLGQTPDKLVVTVVGEVSERDLRAHCLKLTELLRPARFRIFPDDGSGYSLHGKLLS